jgi:glyoxylase-like metal-dependent hydrolase (beta-lactamase superfamily II)
MIVKVFVVSSFETNSYVIICEHTKNAAIIDPSFDNKLRAKEIFQFIDENDLKPQFIINTHGHPDHTCGNGLTKVRYRIPIMIHEYDAHYLGERGKQLAAMFSLENSSPPADRLLHDGDILKIGEETLKVIHTPGHSRGGISLLGTHEVFSGDTLFEGSIGRIDFPDSSEADMKNSLKKLASLPAETTVSPGHGPKTTIGEEKANNTFIQ